jgi:hypothetical protein
MKTLVSLAMVAEEFRQLAGQRTTLDKMVEAVNGFILVLRSGQHDFGKRTQAILNMHRRVQNICNDRSGDVYVRVKEMKRVLAELTGIIRNHNRDNPGNQVSQSILDNLCNK